MGELNPSAKQGKELPCEVREIIVEKWLEGQKPFQIAQRLKLPRAKKNCYEFERFFL